MKIDTKRATEQIPVDAEFFDIIDSTSLYLKRKIKDGLQKECFAVSAEQSNGQGRVGKKFYSPVGTGLYVTFAFCKDKFDLNHLTPKIALAAARAIEKVFSVPCQLKWVNDLYMNDRKIGGILCQNVLDFVLIGIGINVEKPNDVPQDLINRFGYITESSGTEEYTELLISLYHEILAVENDSAGVVLSEFRSRCCHVDKTVQIESDNQILSGKCIGIHDDFSLMIDIDGKIRHFDSGFMTLKI